MTFGTTRLREYPAWRPRELLGLTHAVWPQSGHSTVKLGSVADVSGRANDDAESGALVVRRTDEKTGDPIATAADRRVPAWSIQTPGAIEFGSVLVPPVATQPAVLVASALQAEYFSSRFIAVTPDPEVVLPTYLWALLSSRSGQQSRLRVTSGSAAPTMRAADLVEMHIPVPNRDEQQRVDAAVSARLAQVRLRVEQPPASWTKVVRLDDPDRWRRELDFRDLSVFVTGPALGDLADIRSSRSQRSTFADQPLDGWLPVLDVRPGHSTRGLWAPPTQDIVEAGQIVVPRRAQTDAVLATAKSIAPPSCFIIIPREERDAERIRLSLNSSVGRELRGRLGTSTGFVRYGDLGLIPVPDSDSAVPAQSEPLALWLEELLWR